MSPRSRLQPLGIADNLCLSTGRSSGIISRKCISLGTGRWNPGGDDVELFSLSTHCHLQEEIITSSAANANNNAAEEEPLTSSLRENRNPTEFKCEHVCEKRKPEQDGIDIENCKGSDTTSSDSTHSNSIGTQQAEPIAIRPSLFMRVTDIARKISNYTDEKHGTELGASTDTASTIETQPSTSSHSHPNHIHTLKPAPNHNIEKKESELFIALDSNSKTPSPICFHAIDELTKQSIEFISNRKGWVPHSKHHLHDEEDWFDIATIQNSKGCLSLRPEVIQSLSKEVICWTLSTQDFPLAIRTMGILPHSASSVYELMLDSSRTKEYNQYSLGREDLWVLKSNEECIMKVVQGENLPPLRKTGIPFVTFFRGDRKCRDGRRYHLTTRTTKLVDDEGHWDGSKFLSEIKLGANLIVDIDCKDDKCLFISSMAVSSPLPTMVAKKVGLKGGVSFINGLRSLLIDPKD